MFDSIEYRKKILVFISAITVVLFFIPFFWLKSGELSLGGDSSRLYFYDTWGYLRSFALYSIDPDGIGKVDPNQYLLPFLFLLLGLKAILQSNQLLINTIDGLKLAGGFLFIYFIVIEFLGDSQKIKRKYVADLAAILAALFYVFSPSVTENMKYALLIHNQVFLNPIIFYLLLRFLKSTKYIYLWFLLLITFVFSPNFTPKSPPPVFSFYPLVLLFLYFYMTWCLKKPIPWKRVGIGILFFFGLQAFQLIPVVFSALDKGSYLNSRITDLGKNLEYFDAIRGGLGKVSLFLLLPSSVIQMRWSTIVVPFLVLLGFFYNKKENKVLFLSAIFFLITLLFVSANITNFWIQTYRMLFYVPGFSMFRNFTGHWQFVYTFFYALLFGQTVAIVLSKLRGKYVYIIFTLICGLFIMSEIPFIRGDLIHVNHAATNVSVVVEMDPKYHEALSYISTLSKKGKMVLFPFNDFVYQVVHGLNNGAYIGPSTISNVAGMPSYAGYQNMDLFADEFLKLAKQKNYIAIRQLFVILNITYIFHNDDPEIYDTTFATFPYGLTKEYFPNNQKNLIEFIQNISDKKIYEKGNYNIYSIKNTLYPGDFYIPGRLKVVKDTDKNGKKNTSFFENDTKMNSIPTVYISPSYCRVVRKYCVIGESEKFPKSPKIVYKKINPTKYIVEISSFDKPFFLVQSVGYNSAWVAYKTSNTFQKEAGVFHSFLNTHIFETTNLKSLDSDRHILVNGYANGWYIKPDDFTNKNKVLIIEMTGQRDAYISMLISLVSFCILIIWGIILFKRYFDVVKNK